MASKDSGSPAAAFIEAASDLSIDSFPEDSPDRVEALKAARALVRRLQTPVETAYEFAFSMPSLLPALEVARANDVFRALDSENARPKTTKELTEVGDVSLLRRMLRHLAAMNIIGEVGPDTWAATRISNGFARDEIFSHIRWGKLTTYPVFNSLVDFLAGNGYRDVTTNQGNWQAYKGPDVKFFDWIMANPEAKWAFGNMMKGYASQRRSWLEVFDTSILIDGLADGDAVLVDVGGSHGQDALKFVGKHPEMKGRYIVQDLPGVVEEAKGSLEAQGVTAMPHDFFTEQPVKGARSYFLHSILHDWPDEQVRQILRNLRPALKAGYSRLLITDVIIPPTGADPYSTSVDLTMMAVLNARERNEEEWRELLVSEGFEVVKFWHGPASFEGVIESVLKV